MDLVNWQLETPYELESSQWKEINSFIMFWLIGTPSVSVSIRSETSDFGECTQCMVIFMGAWAKYSIQNDYEDDPIKCNLAGLNGVIDFYIKNKEVFGEISKIEKLIELKENNELEAYIKDYLSKKED